MMMKLRSEHISQRLLISMIIIIVSLLFISVPLIVNSYQSYKRAERALIEISVLRNVAELTNNISRERAPANQVMSSTPEKRAEYIQELKRYRANVDQQIEETAQLLKRNGFIPHAYHLSHQLQASLKEGRDAVDAYAATPQSSRSSAQLDHAIQKMFAAWDSSQYVLKHVMLDSVGKDSRASTYYSVIFILSDLRDQAGRVASNIMAAITFGEKIPAENLANSLQNQRQAYYLWDLVHTILPEAHKVPEYTALHNRLKIEFLDQGIPIVKQLMEQSLQGEAYSLTGTQLTEVVVNKFSTVVDLQNYLLDYSLALAKKDHFKAQQKLILTLVVTLISLMAAIFTMVYARSKVFIPLIQARSQILRLAAYDDEAQGKQNSDKVTLLEAIQKLKQRLEQRDILELQLRNIANTDVLTGVSNRLALEEYIKYLEHRPEKLTKTGLIIVDVDKFKHINDTYGHVVGDQAIKCIADTLKAHVRASDLVVRYGGDEFLVLIEQIEFTEALYLADKLRSHIVNQEFFIPELNDYIQVSVSAGVAVGAASWSSLLKKADKHLFRAKARGRNVVAGD